MTDESSRVLLCILKKTHFRALDPYCLFLFFKKKRYVRDRKGSAAAGLEEVVRLPPVGLLLSRGLHFQVHFTSQIYFLIKIILSNNIDNFYLGK